jgi:hypothetical protein
MWRACVLLITMFTMLATTTAQELPKGQFPEGWTVRVDGPSAQAGPGAAPTTAPGAQDITFVVMKPGWHITTGPAAILYDPTQKASGTFTVKSETFLFDPGTRREAYGILIGGRHLDGDQQTYTYFVIRRSGEFLIRRRTGATTTDVKNWTPAATIRTFDEKGAAEHSVKNVLEAKVTPDMTTFLINDTEVARVATRDIDTDGIVGLRVNHQLNIHVSSLEILR